MSAEIRSPAATSDDLRALRGEVRAFLTERMAAGDFVPAVDCWLSAWDEDFSKALGARGWLGMTIPPTYGGHGRSYAERFVVTEELLVSGAPVAAHWIADRQIAPALLRYGTEQQRQEHLPPIARGERYFGIGMSEPDSGSDLASVRTRGRRVSGGWRVTGTKVWTSGAHRAHAFFALVRTSQATEDRHAGLSQLIVRLDAPGVTIAPIMSMAGTAHFNEVHLDDVFVPDGDLLGQAGNGWRQVTSELAFERSGPERFLSTFPLLAALAEHWGRGDAAPPSDLGRLAARVSALHLMSESVSQALEDGRPADLTAAAVKILGTTTDGDIAELGDHLVGSNGTAGLETLIREALLARPGFSLRGGTNEILRGIVARQLGVR